MASTERKVVNLALQGGGAHGAFTWGALNRILEDEQIEIEGITATSAGAMNAAALKHGWVENGREGARESLEQFWSSLVGLGGMPSAPVTSWLRQFAPSTATLSYFMDLNPAMAAGEMLGRAFSPYQFNPTGYHPLRSTVEKLFDFDRVQSDEGPTLFIATTHVRTGKGRIFTDGEVNADVILASACLPTIYQAIEIPDPDTGRPEPYWDGGFIGNPALHPLFAGTSSPDIVIVHVMPMVRDRLPHDASTIENRINEISFNASLLSELRTIRFVNRLIDDGSLEPGRMKRNYLHSVRDDAFIAGLGVTSKMTLTLTTLLEMRDRGYAAMDRFLDAHRGDIGKESTMDLDAILA